MTNRRPVKRRGMKPSKSWVDEPPPPVETEAFKAELAQQALAIERCARQAYAIEAAATLSYTLWHQQSAEVKQAFRDVAGIVRVALLRALAVEQLAALQTRERM